jgi:hypothetical protein
MHDFGHAVIGLRVGGIRDYQLAEFIGGFLNFSLPVIDLT